MEQVIQKEAIKNEIEAAEIDPIDLILVLLKEISTEIENGTAPEDLVEWFIGKVIEE